MDIGGLAVNVLKGVLTQVVKVNLHMPLLLLLEGGLPVRLLQSAGPESSSVGIESWSQNLLWRQRVLILLCLFCQPLTKR